MTIITVEIGNDQDHLAVKKLLGLLGLNYQEENTPGLLYTDELKKTFDGRYADYLEGRVELIGPEESEMRILKLFAAAGK
jgi:hypothetical protein